MNSAGTLQRPRDRAPRPARPALALLSACFACALALAQSGGRREVCLGAEESYRPVGDYGPAGDGQTAALVASDGSVD